jgi:hypothetical protein
VIPLISVHCINHDHPSIEHLEIKLLTKTKELLSMVRSHGLVVKREDSQLSGCGFESWRCILDSCQRSITIEKLMKNTGSQMGHPKKKIILNLENLIT